MTEEALKFTAIKQWAEDDRPREKVILKGIQALSDAELIAILIATGTKDESAVDLGKRVLSLTGNNLNELGRLNLNELRKIRGIGTAKALSISAALELGRRRKLEETSKSSVYIRTSKQAYLYLEPRMTDLKHEEFWVAYLNRSNKIIEIKKVSEGGVTGTVADPKIIFKHALDLLASIIILSHNHPSGNADPSPQDISLTRKIVSAGKLLDISVMDHIIIGDNKYYSFAESGEL
jgi:DNA repair protein RadC